jgi:hypothetical protein
MTRTRKNTKKESTKNAKNNENPLKCSDCNKHFARLSSLMRHFDYSRTHKAKISKMDIKHNENEEDKKEEIDDLEALKKKIEIKFKDSFTERVIGDKGRFVCNDCGHSYTQHSTYKRHVIFKRCVHAEKAKNDENKIEEVVTKVEVKKKKADESILNLITQEELEAGTESFYANIMERSDKVLEETRKIREDIKKLYDLCNRNVELYPPLQNHLYVKKGEILKGLPESIPPRLNDKIADFLCRANEASFKKNRSYITIFCGNIHTDEPTLQDYTDFFNNCGNYSASTVTTMQCIIKKFLRKEFGWSNEGLPRANLSICTVTKSVYAPRATEVNQFINNAKASGYHRFAVFVWFAFTTGQRLSDLLACRKSNLTAESDGIYKYSLIAKKTNKIETKFISGRLYDLINVKPTDPNDKEVFYDITTPSVAISSRKKEIQRIFRLISADMDKKMTCKNLRAGHITEVGYAAMAAKKAGSHSAISTTVTHYLDPKLMLPSYDLSDCFKD